MSKFFAAAILNLCFISLAWAQSAPQEVKSQESKEAPLPQLDKMLPEGVELPDSVTKLQEKYIALQESLVALRQYKMSKGKGDANALDAAKLGLLQSKLGIEKDQSKKLEILQEIVKIRSESKARSERKQKNGKASEDDTLMQEIQLIAAQIELLNAGKASKAIPANPADKK
ncbi:MAG: hypothetical protein E6Q34_10305 [Burkholderiaceae bacterium]|nr:MAG: hypothetical protein E6Q34_10305 [Burkholderiaceae bacterium]